MKKDLIYMLSLSFIVLFIGFIISAVLNLFIKCIFDGFHLFTERLADLPFLLYFILSIVISTVFCIYIHYKSKNK